MKQFQSKIQAQFNKMCETGKLFRVDISGADLYNLYLAAFGNDPVFRDPESSIHNCNLCSNFIRRYGNIVAIGPDNQLMSIFGGSGIEEEYADIAFKLNGVLTSINITNIFIETFNELNSLPYEKCTKNQGLFRLGIPENFKRYTAEEADKFGVVKTDEVRTFNHLYLDLPGTFVSQTSDSAEAIMAKYRAKFDVFSRCMQEISADTLELVRDLINQESLLDGKSHLHAVEFTLSYKKQYDLVPLDQRVNWCWKASHEMREEQSKFKNTLIGVLCTELSEGMDLNLACSNWNKRVDPANYHKVKSPITQRQVEEAQKFVTENGYMESFDRRLATADDINVTEIKHIATNGVIKAPVTMFDNIKTKPSTQHKRAQFDDVEEVHIDKFMKDILPSCSGIEVLLLNNHEGNLVTLTTAKQADSKPIFKWGNNYSWTFNGNLAGKSQIKEAVKTAGGKVDGVLRFSIMWAEGDPSDNSDLDAWCHGPGMQIGYSSKSDYRSGGNLDIDITNPNSRGNTNIVENITWPKLEKMPDGDYVFHVHQFADRGSKGFQAEIEFNGEVFNYSYNKAVWGRVEVARVNLNKGQFTITHTLPATNASKELWGLQTQEFHKVNLVCLSPNHWADNAVGNKHFMFMLEDCKIPSSVRGFHNENLLPELLEKHRKVMDVLGATNMIEPTDKQLSGIGFNSTVRDELIVKLSGSHKRVVKLKF